MVREPNGALDLDKATEWQRVVRELNALELGTELCRAAEAHKLGNAAADMNTKHPQMDGWTAQYVHESKVYSRLYERWVTCMSGSEACMSGGGHV